MSNASARVPLSLKLMATTIVLLLLTMGLYSVMNVRTMGSTYDEFQVQLQENVLRRAGSSAGRTAASIGNMAGVLLTAGAYEDLKALLDRMAKDDPKLLMVEVFEGDRVVAKSGAIDNLEPTQDAALIETVATVEPAVTLLERTGEEAGLAGIRTEAPFNTEGIKGRVRAVFDIQDLAETTRAIEARLENRKSESITTALSVGGVIILLGIVLTILQSLRISRPIRELTQSVERIAQGNFKERAQVNTNDEIGVLGRNFNYMAERLGVLLTETKEKATYEKEMEVARVIQESLLPPSRVIDKGFFQFRGYFKSASICGGDWWNFAELSGGRLLMMIGDVTGHGVSSAMITAAAKSCCDTLRHVTEGELTVTFLLDELNKTIYEAAQRKFVMTFFATIIDPRERTLTFSNAGHNFPLLFRADTSEGPAIVPLVTRGNRLGDVMESRFLERTVPYSPGDVLVWYTDGLTEGIGKDGSEYGEKRFRRSIRAMLDKGPGEILEKVIHDAESFFADFARPEDDITLVVGKFPERS